MDADALHQCAIRAYSPFVARLNGAPLPPLEADYGVEISQWPTWVLERDGEIIGGLTMDFGEEASISNVFLDPSAQGGGLGRRLLEFAEAEAGRRGYMKLWLATHVLFTENVAAYRHLGWKETGRDETRVFMAKPVAAATST